MRGHEAIRAMRLVGAAPACVWLHDVPAYTEHTSPGKGWQLSSNHAQVEVLEAEAARRLDLRFAAEMTLWVHTRSAARLQSFVAAAKDSGVARVLGVLLQGQGEATTVAAMTDTEGVFAWGEPDGQAAA